MPEIQPYEDPLLEAIRQGFLKAHYESPADYVINEIAFQVNLLDGRLANEALKKERFNQGLKDIADLMNDGQLNPDTLASVLTTVAGL